LRPPEDWRRARVTVTIAAVTVLAWGLATGLGIGDGAAVWAGFIPARVGDLPNDGSLAPLFLTPLTATLVHAGLWHLLFNLLMHVFCGRSVEAIIGGPQLAILYVTGAYAAAASHYLVDPADLTPMIGASGAISAVLGAYAMLFGRNRVKIANPTVALWVNALWLMAAWVGLQLIVGLTFETTGSRVAIAAHIGGFLAGLLLAKPLLLLRYRKA
jgi:membrane associated rhomboid family serine protease